VRQLCHSQAVAEMIAVQEWLVADALAAVEDALREVVASEIHLLESASAHIVASGGKRLRPRIVLLAYAAAGGTGPHRALPLATAVELLHTASLIHDDINDRSALRRGSATVNARWGNGLALLVGDFLFVRLLNLIADMDPRVIRVLADCCTDIVEGETLQTMRAGDLTLTKEDYVAIVSQKTASLTAACGRLGALAANAADVHTVALESYGHHLGIAFQIRDDTLDLVGDTTQLGKPVAADLEQGKMSLAPIIALERSPTAEQVLSSGDASQIAHLLSDTGAIDAAMRYAIESAERAKSALSPLPSSDARNELVRLADFVVSRCQ